MKKKAQLTFAALLMAAALSAQNPLGQAIGGSEGEYFRHVSATPDGGYLLTGSTDSQDADVSSESLGGGDLWVVKTSATGVIEWQRRYGGAGHESGVSTDVSKDGEQYFVTATIDSLEGDVTEVRGQQDIWLLCLKPSGDMIWQRTLGGSLNDQAVGVLALAEGGCIVYGHTTSTDGDITTHQGSTDIWLVRLDYAGQVVWNTTLGGTALEEVTKVVITPDGGFMVVGSTTSNDASMPLQRGEADALLARLDANGQLVWLRTYGGSNDDTFADIVSHPSNGWFLCGQTNSSDGDIPVQTNQTDVWLLYVDESGQVQWSQTYGGKNDDMGVQIHRSSESELLLVANAFELEEGLANKAGKQFDAWLLTVNMSKGEVLHSKLIGGSGQDFVFSSTLENGKAALSGLTDSNDEDITGAKGRKDGLFFLMTEDELSEFQRSEPIRAWPNPAQTDLQFSKPTSGYLWSDTGILMSNFNETARIDISTLPAGVYYIKVAGSAQVLRIVKMIPDTYRRNRE